mmetsp:Transcript_17298/g.24039  ORF Transcript_17298/g.24039 Transcript_17298/m.24039 type:complete len:342 (+) Transcript_17298:23-1048(+)
MAFCLQYWSSISCFIVFLVLFQQTSAQCTNTTYGTKDQSCRTNSNDNKKCQVNLYCDPTSQGNGVCTSIEPGHTCSTSNDCTFPFSDCIQGQCDHKRFPGDSCTVHAQCSTDACVDNICKGISEGLPCNPNEAQCAKGLYCNATGVCVPQKLKYELCTLAPGDNAALTCQPGFYCDTNRGNCTRYRSLSRNERCSDDYGCEAGLTCDNGECRSYTLDTNEDCRDDNDCPYALCVCVNGGSTAGVCGEPIYNLNCTDTDYWDCIEAHDCYHQDWAPWVDGTCANQCKCEMVAFESCYNDPVPNNMLADIPDYKNECVDGENAASAQTLVGGLMICSLTLLFL